MIRSKSKINIEKNFFCHSTLHRGDWGTERGMMGIIDVTEIKIASPFVQQWTLVLAHSLSWYLATISNDMEFKTILQIQIRTGSLSFSQAFQNHTSFTLPLASNPDPSNCKSSLESSQPNIPTLNAATTLSLITQFLLSTVQLQYLTEKTHDKALLDLLQIFTSYCQRTILNSGPTHFGWSRARTCSCSPKNINF